MHMSLHKLRLLSSSRRLSEFLLKETLKCILQALDFLHREASIVHTGTFPYSQPADQIINNNTQ